jgi:peptidoglycan/xylan/chitin deacetylase (PgdA/CDA1 family)
LHITVDDGNRSDTQILLDELARRELIASFFVVAGRIDKHDFLTAEDVRTIVEAGHSLGSHGLTHRAWRELDRDELEDELATAREMLEAIVGRPVTDLACPFGSYDRHVLRRARKLGYECVFTSDGGPADPHAWLRPRTTISNLGQPPVAELVRSSGRIPIARRAKQTVKRWR